jgi:predicted SAM-dependent methyltransferase
MSDAVVKLHLGCGDFHLDGGWTNIDQRMQPGVDKVDNIGILRRHKPGTVDLIYCSHAFDHFSRWDYPRVLRRWHELLKPDGVLWLSTVDFKVVADLYLNGGPTGT